MVVNVDLVTNSGPKCTVFSLLEKSLCVSELISKYYVASASRNTRKKGSKWREGTGVKHPYFIFLQFFFYMIGVGVSSKNCLHRKREKFDQVQNFTPYAN